MKSNLLSIGTTLFMILLLACSMELQPGNSCHEQMIAILKDVQKKSARTGNPFSSIDKLPYMDSLLSLPHSKPGEIRYCNYLKANILLELGHEKEAIKIFERLVKDETAFGNPRVQRDLAMAYLRLGERSNCIANHAAESCIFPIQGSGIHSDADGSRKAIAVFEDIVKKDPLDIESKWLLNIAYMTVGDYPRKVPKEFLIPGLEGDTTYKVKPFEDVAGDLKLNVRDMAGGSITDDFNNDGYLDIILTCWGLGERMHYFKNNANGTFSDVTEKAGLKGITGGLNAMQMDYNNDGFKDVFILRGAWKAEFGKEPNSLLRNNGDDTFTDVTTQAGLLSFHPTQTATWNDFNNDGWLDVFIGNESLISSYENIHPCELYINNQDGTFREIAVEAHCVVVNFVKGVTSGDYDNDGWKDIFISTLDGERKLLRNMGIRGKEVSFENITKQAGLDIEKGRTFTTWFWDYNNDGWLDILAGNYSFEKSLAYYAAAEKLNISDGKSGRVLLYKNNQDGTFTDVSVEAGLTRTVFAMGANFGDIDNDGFLDMYLGTGNPRYQSLVPNVMFKNLEGKKFADVTASARVGHLQKGHGVSFADMDNDGDQDIHIEMGGAYQGDSYENSFFLNPGQNDNKWIAITLEGQTSNRAAIGTQIKLTFRENNTTRYIYRDVNSGGSFGSSPLRREIGLGQTEIIDELEIHWHGSDEVQVFKNIKPNQFIKITEGKDDVAPINLKRIDWILPDRLCLPEENIKATRNN